MAEVIAVSIFFSPSEYNVESLDLRPALTCCEGMKWECPVDSSSLEDCLHDEVVGAVDPEGVVAKSLS